MDESPFHDAIQFTHYVPVQSPPTPAASPDPTAYPHPPTALTHINSLLCLLSLEELQILQSTLRDLLRRDILSHLPGELLLNILDCIEEPYDILSISGTCKRLHDLCSEETLWKSLSMRWRFDQPSTVPPQRAPNHEESIEELEPFALLGVQMDPALEWIERRRSNPCSPITTPRISWRNHFRWNYRTLMNWRKHGTLLRSHRIGSSSSSSASGSPPSRRRRSTGRAPPMDESVALSTAVVTSSALDDECLVVGLSNSKIQIYSAQTGVLSRTLLGHTDGVWSVALVKRGGSPSSADPPPPPLPEDPTLTPQWRSALGFDSASSLLRGQCTEQSDPCNVSEGWGQPNSLVVSGGCDKMLKVWDVRSGYCIHTLPSHTQTIRCVKVLHHSPIAVSGSRDATLKVWDIQRGRLLRTMGGHDSSVRCLDVWGRLVVSGSYDTTCRLWNVDTGECMHVFRGHFHQIYTVAWSTDGNRVVSAGLDSTVRVWDIHSGQCLALLQGHTNLIMHLQLTPSYLTSAGSDGRIIVYSLLPNSTSNSKNEYAPIQKINAHEGSVTSLQIHEGEGRGRGWAVSGGHDGVVRVFELTNGDATECRSGSSSESFKWARDLGEVPRMDSVWKVVFRGSGMGQVIAVMGSRGGRTCVEVWKMGADVDGRSTD